MTARWSDPMTPPVRTRGEAAAHRGARPPHPTDATFWLAFSLLLLLLLVVTHV